VNGFLFTSYKANTEIST